MRGSFPVVKWVAVIGMLFAILVAGCGENDFSQEELDEARAQGERAGRAAASSDISGELLESYEAGYNDGEQTVREELQEEEEESGVELNDAEVDEIIEEVEAEELGGAYVNPEPLNQYGEPSQEFEPDDIERAEEADQELREYCEGAVSEAQEVGCLSHAEP